SLTNVPSGFAAQTSVPQITIPPGETAEVGICLRPTGALGVPGTPASFSVTVTSNSNPAVSALVDTPFTLPSVPALLLSATPASASTTPGGSTTTTLTFQSVGNVAVSASLSSTLDSNLSLAGLPASVNLAPNQSISQTLTLTPLGSAPLGVPLPVTIEATF